MRYLSKEPVKPSMSCYDKTVRAALNRERKVEDKKMDCPEMWKTIEHVVATTIKRAAHIIITVITKEKK